MTNRDMRLPVSSTRGNSALNGVWYLISDLEWGLQLDFEFGRGVPRRRECSAVYAGHI